MNKFNEIGPAFVSESDENDPSAFPRRAALKGAAAFGALVFLSACGEGKDGTTKAKSDRIVVKDQRGTTLTFNHPVRRIVTMPMPAASIVIAVDQSPKHLVGMNEASWQAIKQGVLGEFFPDSLKIAHNVAGDQFAPNVESVLKLKPDVVVQWSNQGAGIITPMENVKLDVLGVEYGTQEDVNKWISMFATMLGKPERAKKMISRNDKGLTEVKALAAKVSGKQPKVLYFNRFLGGLKVANEGGYNDFYINLVGAQNAAKGLKSKESMAGVDVEQVLKWDPDVIILGNFDASVPNDIYSNKVWKDVSAVRSRRVYKVPLGGYRWDPPSHESPLMWRWLFKIVHPDVDSSSLRKHIENDYKFFYDVEVTDAQIDKILWTKLNQDSADYGQFDAT